MSHNDSWDRDAEREIFGFVNSLAQKNPSPFGAPWVQLLVDEVNGPQRNVELTARHVNIIDESDVPREFEPEVVVIIHQEASGTPGCWTTEEAEFHAESEELAGWIRKAFGFHRPGEPFDWNSAR